MNLIVAVNNNGTIGQHGKIAWKCKEDMLHFKKLTSRTDGYRNHLIVGSKTAENLPDLNNNGRIVHVVGADSQSLGEHVSEAMYGEMEYGVQAWVIGGAKIYDLLVHLCDEIHISHINDDTVGDTKWEIPTDYRGKVFHYNFEVNGGDIRNIEQTKRDTAIG